MIKLNRNILRNKESLVSIEIPRNGSMNYRRYMNSMFFDSETKSYYWDGSSWVEKELEIFGASEMYLKNALGEWSELTVSEAVKPTPLEKFISKAELTNQTQIDAVTTMYNSLQSSGLLEKMVALYPFVGGTELSNSYNLINPDLYRLTFYDSSPSAHTANGFRTFGCYADTGIIPTTSISATSNHITMYQSDVAGNSGIDIRAVAGSNYFSLVAFGSPLGYMFYSMNAGNGRVNYWNSGTYTPKGFLCGSRTAADFNFISYNGSTLATKTTATGLGSLPDRNIWIGANDDQNGSFSSKSSKTYGFISVGSGLSEAEAATLNTIVTAYNSTLSRL